MMKTLVIPGLLALAFAVCLIAQTEADYPGWMKDIAATKGKITKGVAAKQNADVATDAEHLGQMFNQVASFWSARKGVDAEGFAKKGESAATDLATAAKAGDESRMQSSLQAINGTCVACHMAHREGTPGNFKIK